jgi:alpha-beta hydrolase superfamily lysophospholipase
VKPQPLAGPLGLDYSRCNAASPALSGMMFGKLLACCSLALLCMPAAAGDTRREQGIAFELSEAIIEGDSVFLEVDGWRFWNIYTPPEGDPRGAVIILHGRGLHPDWPEVVRPLRLALPRHGWATFAMQLPVLAKGAEFADYAEILHQAAPRIEAGIAHLRALGHQQVHLVAHSCGAHMAMAWLDAGGAGIDSLTLVSHGIGNYQRRFGHPPPLDRVPIPVLDIYGSADFVARRAPERLALLRQAGNPASRQIEVPGARHMFRQQGDELARLIAEWLADLPATRPGP